MSKTAAIVIGITTLIVGYGQLADRRAEKWEQEFPVSMGGGHTLQRVTVRPFLCGVWPVCETVTTIYASTSGHPEDSNPIARGPHQHILTFDYPTGDVATIYQKVEKLP